MNPAISAILFYVFAAAALLAAMGVVAFRNPVTCALSMALCFGFTAAIFFGMGASFLGISQIIVYAGAILVLFLFIVMMLDVKKQEEESAGWLWPVVGVVVAAVFAGMMVNSTLRLPGATGGRCPVHVLVEHSGELCVSSGAKEGAGDCCCAAAAAAEEPAALGLYGAQLPALQLPEGKSDAQLLGHNIFTHFNITFVILSFALLAGAVGAVSIGRKLRRD